MDRYQQAIEHLNRYPEELESAALFPGDHRIAGCLFLNAGERSYSFVKLPNGRWLSNPVYIRGNPDQYAAQEEVLTNKIIADERLPRTIDECGLVHLSVLAEYQRACDKWWKRRLYAPRTTEGEDTGEEIAEVDESVECGNTEIAECAAEGQQSPEQPNGNIPSSE